MSPSLSLSPVHLWFPYSLTLCSSFLLRHPTYSLSISPKWNTYGQPAQLIHPPSISRFLPPKNEKNPSLTASSLSLSLSLKLFSQMACRSLFHVSPTSCFFKKPPLPLTDKLLHFLTTSPKRACTLQKLLHLAKKKEMITVPKNIGVYTSLSRLFHDTFW